MSFEELKSEVMDMSPRDKRRLILEVVPEIWPNACPDETCALKIRDLVDMDIVKPEMEMHMWGI